MKPLRLLEINPSPSLAMYSSDLGSLIGDDPLNVPLPRSWCELLLAWDKEKDDRFFSSGLFRCGAVSRCQSANVIIFFTYINVSNTKAVSRWFESVCRQFQESRLVWCKIPSMNARFGLYLVIRWTSLVGGWVSTVLSLTNNESTWEYYFCFSILIPCTIMYIPARVGIIASQTLWCSLKIRTANHSI